MEEQLLEIARKSIWSKDQVEQHIDKIYKSAAIADDPDAFIRQIMIDMWTSATSHLAIEKCYRAMTGGLISETSDKIRTAMFAAGKEKGYE